MTAVIEGRFLTADDLVLRFIYGTVLVVEEVDGDVDVAGGRPRCVRVLRV